MIGNISGKRYDFEVFKTISGTSNNVLISDLTIDCNATLLSSTADVVNGDYDYKAFGAILTGSNNTYLRVRCINTFGSIANSQEQFGLAMNGGSTGSSNNWIIGCLGRTYRQEITERHVRPIW